MRNCVATAKSTGKPCKAQAIKGAKVCRVHGGAAPQVQAAARRRIAERDLLRYAAERMAKDPQTGEPPDPQQVLEDLIDEERGVLRFWGIVMEEMIAGGDSLTTINKHGEQVIKPQVGQRNDASLRLARIAKYGLDGNLSERRLQIEEEKAHLVLQATRAALARKALGLPPELQQDIVRSIGQELRQLGPGNAEAA